MAMEVNGRLNPFGNAIGPAFAKHVVSADRVLAGSSLPMATQELVKIRASQINGCGACLDIHVKEAAHAGESALRLGLVATWRETTVFTGAERAALELAEAGTRLADGGRVGDEVWAEVAAHYDEEQQTALVMLISLINAFNRMNVIVGQRGGGYEVGQLAG